MALNGTTAGTAVANAIAGLTQEQLQDPTLIWQTIMTAIYSDLVANAQVSTVVASGIAVQTVPATGTGTTVAPGAGTGSIT